MYISSKEFVYNNLKIKIAYITNRQIDYISMLEDYQLDDNIIEDIFIIIEFNNNIFVTNINMCNINSIIKNDIFIRNIKNNCYYLITYLEDKIKNNNLIYKYLDNKLFIDNIKLYLTKDNNNENLDKLFSCLYYFNYKIEIKEFIIKKND